MEYRTYPHGGERIGVIGMGSSVIGARPESEIIGTVRAAVELGVNCFDMAGGHAAIFGAYGKALQDSARPRLPAGSLRRGLYKRRIRLDDRP